MRAIDGNQTIEQKYASTDPHSHRQSQYAPRLASDRDRPAIGDGASDASSFASALFALSIAIAIGLGFVALSLSLAFELALALAALPLSVKPALAPARGATDVSGAEATATGSSEKGRANVGG